MLVIPRDSFTITHYDSLLANATRGAGLNLLPNQGFELGNFGSWATHTNWSVVAASSVTPNGMGNYVAQAASASYGQQATLESNRVAVSGTSAYLASITFASPSGVPKRANNLRVTVRWWAASSGGSALREDTVWASPVKAKKGGMRYAQIRLTSPAGANYASFVIRNAYGSSSTGAGNGVLADDPFLAGIVTVANLSALDVWEYKSAPIGFRNLKFSWQHQMGCKRLAFRVNGPSDYLWVLMQTALGHHVETHFENDKLFGGMLWSMNGRIGNREMGITLDSLANFIKVPYGQTFYAASDADSMLRYGRKDLLADESFNTQADARAYANFLLNESAFPRPTGEDAGGSSETDYLDIEVLGLGATLQWVTDLPPMYVGFWDSAYVAAKFVSTNYGQRSVLGRVSDDTPNDFISRDYALVEDTGNLIPPMESTSRRSSQELLLDLIGRGTSNKRGIVAGVGADRRFFMRERPTTLTYYRERDRDGKPSFYDTAGNEVPRPLVRCGEFLTDGVPVPSYAVVPGSDAARDPANRFIVETEYSHEENDMKITLLGKRRLGLDLARAVRKTQ